MDEVFNKKSKQEVLFHFTHFELSDRESYFNYMEQLLKVIVPSSVHAKLPKTERELVCTAHDIPFYHYAKYPDLALFRFYSFSDALHDENLSYRKFCALFEKRRFNSLCEQIHQAIKQTPSREVWTEQTIDPILRMLYYYFETDVFDNAEEVLNLLHQLKELIKTIKHDTENGYKESNNKTPFMMNICSVDVVSNVILRRNGDDLSCLIELFNNIAYANELLSLKAKKWIDLLCMKSIQISGSSSFKERRHFFQTTESKIEKMEDTLKDEKNFFKNP